MLYQKVLKPILFQYDPERVHDFFIKTGEMLGGNKIGRRLTSSIYGYTGPDISKTVDGVRYETPIILGAGFDYDARLTQILPSVSFGGVEVGSITARPYAGNAKPRLTRLQLSKSILVNKGLKNEGVDKIIDRLQKKERIKDFVIGVSIARTNDAKTASLEDGITDYFETFQKLVKNNIGDYYTLNISCPNSFGGETFANAQRLPPLLKRIREIDCEKPIYIKMPINLPWHEFSGLLKIIMHYQMNGVVIGNLNKDYGDPAIKEALHPEYQGAFSGTPCFRLSNELIRKTREMFKEKITIIGCGGILTPENAMEKISAGADLIQLITGMIFTGPDLMKQICQKIASSSASRA